MPKRISRVVERLRGVRVENKNAKDLLVQYLDRPATLIYLDPPYFADRTNSYTHDENNPEFHRELLNLANHSHCMIFISGYANDLYAELLTKEKGWNHRTIETTTKDSSGQSHNRTEVVWMNKYFQKAQAANGVPIVLTEKRIKAKEIESSSNKGRDKEGRKIIWRI